jgi:hypothetical protein
VRIKGTEDEAAMHRTKKTQQFGQLVRDYMANGAHHTLRWTAKAAVGLQHTKSTGAIIRMLADFAVRKGISRPAGEERANEVI